jgi:hypothetical protein
MTDDHIGAVARNEFRARAEAGLLDEQVKATKAAEYAAAVDTSDLSDAALRRAVAKILAQVRSEDFVEGSPQRKQRYLRELRKRLIAERAKVGDPLKVLDERLSQQDELGRRVERMRRS